MILLLLTLAACNKQVESNAAAEADGASEQIAAGEPVPADITPPEKYATLPPGAFEDPAAETAPAEGEAGAAATDSASEAADDKATATKPDRGLVPNAGELTLTGIRLGMNRAEITGRYPVDSGWTYDQRFIEGTETGVVLAKPNDVNARATEMTMLQDGVAVAFLRAVREDSETFRQNIGELSQSFGTPVAAPPDWARQFKLFAKFHTAANEQSRFWASQPKRQVLTAGHSPSGAETVYMLVDLPRMQQVQAAMDAAKLGMPDEAPPVDPGWAPPPGAEVNPPPPALAPEGP